jgi:hypothetical protein
MGKAEINAPRESPDIHQIVEALKAIPQEERKIVAGFVQGVKVACMAGKDRESA